jgi:hypothetical protein
MLKRITITLAVGLGVFCLLSLSTVAHAQAVFGSIFGTVTDNTGAAIPGATVTVTDPAKGTSIVIQSGASGEFSAEHLIPDIYDIKTSFQGFQTSETKGIQVFADASQKIDVKLTVGGANTTVEVSADTVPTLKTDRADVSTVFNAKTVEDLPVGDRNFTNLQLLLPGAQPLSWAHAASENPQASKQIQIDGQAFGGVGFILDGTDNQDPILGIIVINPTLESVSETKITTQNFDAEFGKAVSSIVTAQTKSGSNKFHGSVFDYRQSNANLARDPYSQFPGTLFPAGLKNQFGGSIGGPVLKDRLFFFADYQGLRQKVGISNTDTVPTSHLINTCLGQEPTVTGQPGCDFSEYLNVNGTTNSGRIYQQVTQPDGSTASVPYAGNVIPAAQISPQALNFIKLLQPYAPNTSGTYGNGLIGNYAEGGIGGFNNDQWDERVDFTLSEKIHIFERYSRFTDTLTGTEMFGDAGGPGFGYQGYGGTSKGANGSVAAGADIAISSSLLTDFRLGYYRYNIKTSKYDQGSNFASDTLGIPGLNTGTAATSGAPAIEIDLPGQNGLYGTGLNVNHCNCPLTEKEDQFQIVNNWTKIIRTHSVKIGADLRYARNLRVPSDNNRTGQLFFNGSPTENPNLGGTGEDPVGGLGWATMLLGQSTQLQRYVSASTNAKEFQKRFFFYAQDTWRATPNLTVNYGLRYEFYGPESVNGAGNGALMNLNDGYLRVAGVGKIGKNMNWNPAAFPFNPRVGIAYQFDPKTVIRGGYGRSFDIGVFGSIFGHVVTQNLPVLANQQINPLGSATSYAFCLGPNTPGCTQPNGQPAVGGPVAYTSPVPEASGLLAAPGYAVSNKARPNDLRLPTVDAWNLSVQRAITPTLSLTMAYVANKSTHTLSAGDGNNTNPNETALVLPAQFSVVGQPLHWDPTVSSSAIYSAAFPQFPGIAPDGGTQTAKYLQRYYGGTLAACQDPAYVTSAAAAGATIPNPGACGWTNGVSYYGDDQDAEFDALQITLAKQFTKGLQFTANYAWQKGYDFASNYATWNRHAVKGRNNDIREQQIVIYGNYQLPFGRKGMFATNAPRWADEIIGGWQLSPVMNWSSGLPFTLNYNGCNSSVGGTSAPCYLNGSASFLKTSLGSFNSTSHSRSFYKAQPVGGAGSGTPFTAPGLDQIGNVGRNSNFGPGFFNTDLSLQKDFPIIESILVQFRVDAYNVFNHINPALGGGGPTYNVQSDTSVTSSTANFGQNPRQLQFSFRVQF